MKKLFAVITVLIAATAPATATLGIIPYETSKTSEDLQESFQFGLVNTGNQKLNISISSTKSENYDVAFSNKEFVLNSTQPSQTPFESNNYFNGQRYFQVVKNNLTVQVNERRSTNDLEPTVNVRATPYKLPEGYSGPRITQLREIKYQLNIDRLLIKGLQKNDKQNSDDALENQNRSDPEVENRSETSSDNTKGRNNTSSEKTSGDQINWIFVAGIFITGIYIYRVL